MRLTDRLLPLCLSVLLPGFSRSGEGVRWEYHVRNAELSHIVHKARMIETIRILNREADSYAEQSGAGCNPVDEGSSVAILIFSRNCQPIECAKVS